MHDQNSSPGDAVRQRFSLYSETAKQEEYQYLQRWSPSWFLRLLHQFETPNTGSWLDSCFSDNRDHIKYELVDDSYSFDLFRASVSRTLRYLSSEALIVNLVSGYPYGPTSRVAKKLQNKLLKDLIESIAERKVPNFEKHLKHDCSFDVWIKQMLFHEYQCPTEIDSYIEFIIGEAEFIKDRNVVNAFKHSRMLRPVDGQPIQIDCEDGRQLLPPVDASFAWSEMRYTSEEGMHVEHITTGGEELNFENDCQAVMSAASLMRMMKEIRLARHCDINEFSLVIPFVEFKQHRPFRFKFTQTYRYTAGKHQ